MAFKTRQTGLFKVIKRDGQIVIFSGILIRGKDMSGKDEWNIKPVHYEEASYGNDMGEQLVSNKMHKKSQQPFP